VLVLARQGLPNLCLVMPTLTVMLKQRRYGLALAVVSVAALVVVGEDGDCMDTLGGKFRIS